MKKLTLKKWMSAVIAVLFINSSVVTADGEVLSENRYAETLTREAIQSTELLNVLGVELPAFESATEIVTRGEFVYVLMQGIGYKKSDGDAAPSFDDVSRGDYFAGALKLATDMGIVSGGDLFYPYRNVTANEAYKMMVVSLGRTYQANARGGYPYGFYSVADSCDLNDGIQSMGDNPVSRSDFYVMMSNFLGAHIFETTGITDGEAVMTDTNTVMEQYFDVYETSGVVCADAYTSLYDHTASEGDGFALIGDISYRCNIALELGCSATVYVKKTSGAKDEIIYATYEENNVLKTDTKNISYVNNSRLEYETSGGNIKALNLINSPACIYNGKADPKILISQIPDMNAVTEFVDNDSDGKYDVIKIWEATEILVDYVNVSDKYISSKNSKVIELADSPDKRYFVTADGETAELSDIKSGSIASAYVSRDGLLINIAVSTATVFGTVEEYDTNRRIVIVDGKAYEYSSGFEKDFINQASTGTKGTLLLSVRGIVEGFVAENGTRMEYGYFINIKKESGLADSVKIKLCTSGNDIVVFDVCEKVAINDNTKTSSDSLFEIFAPSGKAEEQLIRYSVDKSGRINRIDIRDKTGFLSGNESDYDNLTLYKFPSNLTGNVTFLKSTSIVFPFFEVADDAVMFRICTNENLDERQRYRVYNAKNYLSNVAAGMKARQTAVYNVTRDNVAGALVVTTDMIGKNIDEYSTGGVIHSVTDYLTDGGVRGLKVVIVKGSEYETYYINDVNVLKEIDPDSDFENPCISPGDAVRISVDDNDTLEGLVIDFDYSEGMLYNQSTSHNAICRYYYGEIYDKVGDKIMVVQKDINDISPEITDETMRYVWRVSGIIPIFDTTTNSVYHSTADDIRTYLSSENHCSRVLVRTSNGAVTYLVIYR